MQVTDIKERFYISLGVLVSFDLLSKVPSLATSMCCQSPDNG